MYEKLRLLNPTHSKEKIFEHLADLLKKDDSQKSTLTLDQFSKAYQGKYGFSTIFVSDEALAPYTSTKELRKNLNYELIASYLNIIHTIEKLPTFLQPPNSL